MGPSTPGSTAGGTGFSAVTPGSAGSSAWSGGRPASALSAGSRGGGDDDDDGDTVTEDGKGGGEDEGDDQQDDGGEDDFGEEALKAKRLEYPAAKVSTCVRRGGEAFFMDSFLLSKLLLSTCAARGRNGEAFTRSIRQDRLIHLLLYLDCSVVLRVVPAMRKKGSISAALSPVGSLLFFYPLSSLRIDLRTAHVSRQTGSEKRFLSLFRGVF